jgi:hypothetical protein
MIVVTYSTTVSGSSTITAEITQPSTLIRTETTVVPIVVPSTVASVVASTLSTQVEESPPPKLTITKEKPPFPKSTGTILHEKPVTPITSLITKTTTIVSTTCPGKYNICFPNLRYILI